MVSTMEIPMNTTHNDACSIIIFHHWYLDVLVSSVALIQFIMARAKRRAVANKATQRRAQATYKCPLCHRFFTKLATRTRHMRTHDMRSPTRNTQSIALPSNNLLSRQASDDVVIFDFNANIADELTHEEDEVDDTSYCNDASDIDSYYSDSNIEKGFLSIRLGENVDDKDEDNDDNDAEYSDYDGDDYDDGDEEIDKDEEDDDNDDQDDDLFIPYFSAPTHVADADVPYSHRTCTPLEQFEGTAAFKMQLELSNIFNKNKASLKLYDDTIALFRQYIRGDDFNTFTPLST
jgi:hypothetical protein